jgi:hypothetical protein
VTDDDARLAARLRRVLEAAPEALARVERAALGGGRRRRSPRRALLATALGAALAAVAVVAPRARWPARGGAAARVTSADGIVILTRAGGDAWLARGPAVRAARGSQVLVVHPESAAEAARDRASDDAGKTPIHPGGYR